MACAPACFPDPGPLCSSTPILSSNPAWKQVVESSATLSNAVAACLHIQELKQRQSDSNIKRKLANGGSKDADIPVVARLSVRGEASADKITPFWHTFDTMLRDAYHTIHNPNGHLNMGIANNSLMESELLAFMNANLKLDPIDLTYGSSLYGSTRLFAALCHHFNHSESVFKPLVPVEPDHIITGPGCGPLLDQVFEHLADEGDAVLSAAPYYNGFDANLATRAKVHCIPVFSPFGDGTEDKSFDGASALRGFREALDRFNHSSASNGHANSHSDGKEPPQVRAILVCNPCNPVGRCYTRSALIEYGKFAATHSLHLVFDEIYSLSTFPTEDEPNPTPFISALSIDWLAESGLSPSYVHILTSASKDFGLNGFRLGIFISQFNQRIVSALKMTAKMYMVSSPADALFSTLLTHPLFKSWFINENQIRLSNSYALIRSWLLHHQIPYTPSNAGHFVLVNLQRFLLSSEKGNISKQDAESLLWAKVLDQKLCITPGSNYHHPLAGTFRLTFSMPRDALLEGLNRLEKALDLVHWIPPAIPIPTASSASVAPSITAESVTLS